VEGTVLISQNELSGDIWGPGELNPYMQFGGMRPADSIAGGISVFHGKFELPLAAAMSHRQAASNFLQDGNLSDALAEARAAVLLAPGDVASQVVLGDTLMRLNEKEDAVAAYERAVSSAQNVYPEFQGYWTAIIKQKMGQ
jgi:tetratricopeptide (TPR) repeat protein